MKVINAYRKWVDKHLEDLLQTVVGGYLYLFNSDEDRQYVFGRWIMQYFLEHEAKLPWGTYLSCSDLYEDTSEIKMTFLFKVSDEDVARIEIIGDYSCVALETGLQNVQVRVSHEKQTDGVFDTIAEAFLDFNSEEDSNFYLSRETAHKLVAMCRQYREQYEE